MANSLKEKTRMQICQGTGNQKGPTHRLVCRECGKEKANSAFPWKGMKLSTICGKCLRSMTKAS